MRSIRTMTSLPASPNGWGARGPAMADARKSYPLLDNQAVAADPRKHAWVSASAGTGKTQVLTARVLRLLLNGADPAGILCITFTKAGAAEMAERLNGVLARWVRCPDKELRQHLFNLGEPNDDQDRTSVVEGKVVSLRVDFGGRLII